MPNYSTVLSPEQYSAVVSFVHSEYGRKSGLIQEDYSFHFDTELENEIEVYGGKVLKIAIRATPFGNDWHKLAKRVFTDIDLKSLLRSDFNNKLPHVTELKSGSEDKESFQKSKDFSQHYSVTAYSVVRVKDKTSGKYIEVRYTGSSFDAIDIAISQLKGI